MGSLCSMPTLGPGSQRLSNYYPQATKGPMWMYDSDKTFSRNAENILEPLKLTDICIRRLCRILPSIDEIPPGLPTNLVDKVMLSLQEHVSLTPELLLTLKHCELHRLSLSPYRGITDDWLAALSSTCTSHLEILDLSRCRNITERGVLQLRSLCSLRKASFAHCIELENQAMLCLVASWKLENIDLTNCRNIGSDGVKSLRHLTLLSHLSLAGCDNIEDEALSHIACLVNLRCLLLERCRLLTDQGIGYIGPLRKLEELRIGWCPCLTDNTLEILAAFHDGGPSNSKQLEISKGLGERKRNSPLSTRRMQLTYLDLSRCSLTDDGFASLKSLKALRKLSMSGCQRIRDPTLNLQGLVNLTWLDLSSLPHATGHHVRTQVLSRLRYLNVSNSTLLDTSVVHDIFGSHIGGEQGDLPLPVLETLILDSCPITDDDVANLVLLTSLTSLDLADTRVTDRGLHLIASKLMALQSLSIFFCAVTDYGARCLTALENLKELNLDSRDITDAGVGYLTKGMPKLRSLDMFSAYRVTDVGLAHLASLTGLTALELCGGRVTSNGVAHLTALTSLRKLNLSQNQYICNEGVKHLSAITSLTSLNLSECRVSGPGLNYLTTLIRLTSLSINNNNIPKAILDGLHRDMPALRYI